MCAVPRLLTHPSVQMLWRKYCSGDSVQASTFLSGVEQFLVQFECMDAATAAELMGPSAPSRTALAAVLDADASGTVCGLRWVALAGNAVKKHPLCSTSGGHCGAWQLLAPSVCHHVYFNTCSRTVVVCQSRSLHVEHRLLGLCVRHKAYSMNACCTETLHSRTIHLSPTPTRGSGRGTQVCMAEVNAVFDQPEAPFLDLLRAAIARGQDATRGRFRQHPVSQLMRRFREEVWCALSMGLWDEPSCARGVCGLGLLVRACVQGHCNNLLKAITTHPSHRAL